MSLVETLRVLAEPTRLRIFDAISERERSVSELVELTGKSQPAVSRHLGVLRASGLVSVRRDAQRRIYSADPQALTTLDAWLELHRRARARQLDRLESHLASLEFQPHRMSVEAEEPS